MFLLLETLMRLTLDRFKAHYSKTLDLPDTGLILLDGNSGAGKSTVLKAFLYAAYGAVSKPVSWNETSCSVSWELKGQTITRGKGKNNITFGSATGDTAQSAIQAFLGMSESEFMASSYIAQKNVNSLLTLTPAEQLRFIESLAFGDQSPDLFKKKIQEKNLLLSGQISSIESKISGLRESMEDLEENDFSWLDVFSQELSEAKWQIAQKKAKKEALQKTLDALKTEHSKHMSILQEMSRIKQKARDLKEMESHFAGRAGTEQIESPEEIARAIKTLENAQGLVKINSALASLDESHKTLATEIVESKAQSSIVEASMALLIDELSNSDHLAQKLKELNQINTDLQPLIELYAGRTLVFSEIETFSLKIKEKISASENKLADLYSKKSDLEASSRLQDLSCPACHEPLIVHKGALCSVNESEPESFNVQAIEVKISEEKPKLSKFQSMEVIVTNVMKRVDLGVLVDFQDLEVLRVEIDNLSTLTAALSLKEKELSKLAYSFEQLVVETKKKAEGLSTIKSQITALLPKVNTVQLSAEVLDAAKHTSEELVQKIADQKARHINALGLQDELEKERAFREKVGAQKSELASSFQALQISANEWNRSEKEVEIDEIESNLRDAQNSIASLEGTIESLVSSISSGEKEKAKHEERERAAKKTEEKILQYGDEAMPLICKRAATLRLKELSDAAQMKAVAVTLDALNLGAKEYLDVLFQDPPISVELRPFKENKDSSVKAKLSLAVSYRGMELDNITDDVSGGENDRIILAYQLAMNSMYNSPILLLDEPFTGLNQELIDTCLDALKILSQNKLILVVAHGINKGAFDDVIDI
jgi:DNA repair exonuclease SbcCD ATPase subunit